MSELEFQNESVDAQQDTIVDEPDAPAPNWGENAPRGARTVLNRIIREGASVPLFFGQTLVNSLRDTGYNNTTSAICEHVDNSVESGASEVRVYFTESGGKTNRSFQVTVLDNGKGMSPNVLQVACAFGGSMRFENRNGIGRFGMGMKAAALSISPVLEVFTWQEPSAFHTTVIDVKAIGQEKANVIMVPEPRLLGGLPPELAQILTSPMTYPKSVAESQRLLCDDAATLQERLGNSGTILFMPNCDRLTHRKIATLVDTATREMSRVYRRQLDKGLRLFINNRLVEPFDPTYQMKSAHHRTVPELAERERTSRLVNKWEIAIPIREGSEKTSSAAVRLYFLPISDWSSLPRKVLKNDLRVFDVNGISFMRCDREVDMKPVEGIVGKRGTRDTWWRMEVDFRGDLDEAFGIAMNKQGVRPKQYVLDLIRKEILNDLRDIRKTVDRHWAEQAGKESGSTTSRAEHVANDAEALQSTLLPRPSPASEAEQKTLDDNLRNLAVGLRREGETDEQAFERIKSSSYVTTNKHDEDAAFYRVDFKLGKVILTLNTAHAFYERLYKPLATVAKKVAETARSGEAEDDQVDPTVSEECSQVLVGLQLFLLSLGRTQSEMTHADQSGERQRTFDLFRRQWSLNLETQLASM